MSGARGTDPADEEVVEDILTYWFSEQFWSKSEPKNPTAHYDELWRQRHEHTAATGSSLSH